LVKSPADLYDLKKEDVQRLDGFKELSTKNLLDGIANSKATPFEAVLFAIGIRYVGKTVAEKLARHFRSIDVIAKASFEELLVAPEIGEKIAQSIVQYFSDANNRKEIERLQAAGLQFEVSGKEPEKVSDALAGKSFLASGTFQNFSRDGINEAIVAHGGKLLSGVSGKLNYLIAGENMGPSKKEKAEKLGVTIISEAEFQKMIGQ
jgi:DNA ligase (NAD+)